MPKSNKTILAFNNANSAYYFILNFEIGFDEQTLLIMHSFVEYLNLITNIIYMRITCVVQPADMTICFLKCDLIS